MTTESKLNVSRLVSVALSLAPVAAARATFGTLLILGDSDIIDGSERFRAYTSLDDVAVDFGTSAKEYLAAALYFGQIPQPRNLVIGRWLRTATSGFIKGGILSAVEQTLATWTAVTAGAFKIDIDDVEKSYSSLDFSGKTTLSGVAEAIDTAIGADGACTWDGSRFKIISASTGDDSTVGYAESPSSGTDISTMLKLTALTALAPIDGFEIETAVEAAAAMADISRLWYGLTFAAATMPNAAALTEVAAFIEAASPSRIFGITETDSRALDGTYSNDLASIMSAAGYNRTMVQYSANPYAVASLMGRAFSVDFNQSKSTITLMYKVQPGITAENLTETQALVLAAKRCNVFVAYNNDTAIVQNGVMAGTSFIDEIHGLDWVVDALQNAGYNLLYTSKTKIPQTDAGTNQLVSALAAVCDQAVENGLIAPGMWNSDGFGQLQRSDFLPSGYYIYPQPIALQAQADREARKAPAIKIALKLAGAFHSIDIAVDVNR